MSRDSDTVRAGYKDICSTLTLAPRSGEAKLAARDAKPDGEGSDVPHFEELTKAAGAFHAAVAKGDMQAIKALLLGPNACPHTVAPEKIGECKRAMAAIPKAVAKELAKLRQRAEKLEPSGWHLMPLHGAVQIELWFAYPADAAHPCKIELELAWPVAWARNRAVIAMLPMKKEEPRRKK
jgi:hypothetical protein